MARHNTFEIDDGQDWGMYEEMIFDIPEEELENYSLRCRVSERMVIQGPWRVTFPITESDYLGEHDDGVPATLSPDFAYRARGVNKQRSGSWEPLLCLSVGHTSAAKNRTHLTSRA